MDYGKIITVEAGKRSGKPCIRGMRITVYDVLGYLASGMSYEEVLADFPDLTREDILACLAFAAIGSAGFSLSHPGEAAIRPEPVRSLSIRPQTKRASPELGRPSIRSDVAVRR